MNIKILDSWLREHVETKATPAKIGEVLSQSSVSVEKIEQVGRDHLYEIEVTTNRPDLMSIVGLARETAVALKADGVAATFKERKLHTPKEASEELPVKITNDPKLVHRIVAVALSVKLDKSPQLIRDRLEATDIRSLNNVVDTTNYVMREVGHPMHAFDLDRITTKHMVIREAKKGEKIVTLDKKEYTLNGGEIVADNGEGEIIDLLGVMGTLNTSVTDHTKNVLLLIDNNDVNKIRKASMELGIRTDAAVLNEKGVDIELAKTALIRGIQLLEEIADAKLTSKITDIYPKPVTPNTISVSFQKINEVMGITISEKQVVEILEGLSFKVKTTKDAITVTPPSFRSDDVTIPEDVIEEVARIYGYHKLPSVLPPLTKVVPQNQATNNFYWEDEVRKALKYWGFTEVYTHSLISEDMLEVPIKDAVVLQNPLTTDLVYMRTTLIPSLLQALRENTGEAIKIFELSNVYKKRKGDLPEELLMLGGVVKTEHTSFYQVKGILEALCSVLGIKTYEFKKLESGEGARILVGGELAGEIEVLDRNVIDFEISFEVLLKHANTKKTHIPLPKFPAAIEDLRIATSSEIDYATIVATIKKADKLVSSVELLDTYEDKKTFRITYQSKERNLNNTDIKAIREKIITILKSDLQAEIA